MKRLLKSRPVLSASLAYLGLTLVLTWPLAPRIGFSVPLGDNDLWQNYWNVWWWEGSLERLRSPFHTDLLFHPTGAPLGWHTHSPANVLSMVPVAWLAEKIGLDGPAAALGAATLAGFFLAALGAFLLAREIVGLEGPAFLAGLAFAFFPQHLEQSLEHLNLASYWAMPFALLYLGRASAGWGPRAWIPAGVFLGINALLSWHNGVLLLFIAIAVAFSGILKAREKRKAIAGIALACALSLLIVLPFLWPMVEEVGRGGGGFKAPIHKPIDPLFLVIPHSGHPLWGRIFAGLYEKYRAYQSMGFMAYLGIGAIFLWILGGAWRGPAAERIEGEGAPPRWAPRGRRAFVFWTAIALFHILLALGHHPLVAGRQLTGIPLPFALLESVPALNTVRVANRFLVPAMLGLSLVAAMGGAGVSGMFAKPWKRRLCLTALGAILVLDYLWLPYPTREIPRPAYLGALEKLPAGLPVLDIPSGGNGPRAALDMLQATRHGRPIAGGYISREPPEIRKTLEEHPVLRWIFLSHPGGPFPEGDALTKAIRDLGIGIVAVHLDRSKDLLEEKEREAKARDPGDLYTPRLFDPEKGIFKGDLDRFREELRRSFGPPVYEDRESEIYLAKKD